jgi:hypothetical protein
MSDAAAPAPASPSAGAVSETLSVFLRILKLVENCNIALAGAAFHPEQFLSGKGRVNAALFDSKAL